MSHARADLDAAVLGLSALVVAGDSYRLAAAAHFGLNVVDTHAISYLDAYGSMSQARLAQLMDLSAAAVTGVVDRLERSGTGRRSVDPSDRRRHRVELTGRAAQILAQSRDGLTRVFADVAPDALQTLIAALPGVAAAMDREASQLRDS